MANDPGLGHILNPESTQGEVGCGNPNAATTTAPVRPNQGWVSQDKSDPVEGMKQGAAIAGAGYLAHNAAKLIPHPIGRGIVMGLADVAMVFGGLKTAYHIVEWTVQEVKKAIGGTTGTTGGTSDENRPAVDCGVMLMRIKTTRPRTTGRPAAATLPSLILTMGATHLERVAEMTQSLDRNLMAEARVAAKGEETAETNPMGVKKAQMEIRATEVSRVKEVAKGPLTVTLDTPQVTVALAGQRYGPEPPPLPGQLNPLDGDIERLRGQGPTRPDPMSGDPFGGSSGTNPGSTGGGCGSGGGVSGQLPVPDITGGTGGRRPLGSGTNVGGCNTGRGLGTMPDPE